MKDYTLSEMREFCKKRSSCVEDCPLYNICFGAFAHMPEIWDDIEPRDMIELPCKEHRINDYGDVWDVYYRDERYGFVRHECRGTEAEADEFIAKLKEKNNE